MKELEFDDIQGMVLDDYSSLYASRYLFLKFQDPAKARSWIKQTADSITTAGQCRLKPGPSTAVNLALTYKGMAILGLAEESSLYFSDEFQQGMAEPDRARIMGDRDESAPEKWIVGGPANDEIHALLLLYAQDAEQLKSLVSSHLKLTSGSGMDVVFQKEGLKRPDSKEHFGFKDGISQPFVEGNGTPPPGEKALKPGDFLLGYENQFNKIPLSPLVPAQKDPENLLKPISASQKDFGQNGSYLVFRVLEQDVLGFWSYFKREAQKMGDGSTMVDYLAAKCVGRWPSGAALALSPNKDEGKDNPRYQPRNDFQYNADDDLGLKCPIGSHVRRANPRDSLHNIGVTDGSERDESLTMVNRHRIIRRGRPYGEYIDNPLQKKKADGERGLLFICLNANISRQFEFIQQTWLNNAKFDGLYDGRDPVIGANDGSASSQMAIPQKGSRQVLTGLSRFVKMKGGAYFFMPGIRALRFLGR